METKILIEQIIAERDFYKRILDCIPAVIHVNNLKTQMVEWVNVEAETISGYSTEEILNNPKFISKSMDEEDFVLIEQPIIYYKQDKGINSYIYSMRHADGRICNYHRKGVVFEYDENGIPFRNIAIDINITNEILNYKQFKRQCDDIALKLNKSKLERLSRRELEVIKYLCAGNSVKKTAVLMGRSHHTIDNHKRNIFKKLGVSKICQVSSWAKEVELI